jgi:hypothetical protein
MFAVLHSLSQSGLQKLYKLLGPPPPASAPSRCYVSVHNPAMSMWMNGTVPRLFKYEVDTKDSFRRSRHIGEVYSRHLGEWNQFGGQAVSTFRSQTLGPHVTHILLCSYFMSGSIHLDTWQRGAPEVATYKVSVPSCKQRLHMLQEWCVLTWDLHTRVYLEMHFSLRYYVGHICCFKTVAV